MSTENPDWESGGGFWPWVCVQIVVSILVSVLVAVTAWVLERREDCDAAPWPLNWICSVLWVLVLVVVGTVLVIVAVLVTVFICGWTVSEPTEEDTDTSGAVGAVDTGSGSGSIPTASRLREFLFGGRGEK